MKKFEYGWYKMGDFSQEGLNKMNKDFNQLGKEGWEVIPCEPGFFILKREIG